MYAVYVPSNSGAYDALDLPQDVKNVKPATDDESQMLNGYDDVFTMGPEQFAAAYDAMNAELEFIHTRREDAALIPL